MSSPENGVSKASPRLADLVDEVQSIADRVGKSGLLPSRLSLGLLVVLTRGLVSLVDSKEHFEEGGTPDAIEQLAALRLTSLLQGVVISEQEVRLMAQNALQWWQVMQESFIVVRNGYVLELARRIVGTERLDEAEMLHALKLLSPERSSEHSGVGLAGGADRVFS